MKIVGSVKEDLNSERRISITPDTVKKFIDLNFSVLIEKNYGTHLGISDEEYQQKGAILKNSTKEVLEKSEIILKVNSLSDDDTKARVEDADELNKDLLKEGRAALRRLVHGDDMHGKKTFISLRRLIAELSIKPDQKVKDFIQ